MSAPVKVGMNLMWLEPGVVGGTEDAAVGLLGALTEHVGEELSLVVYAQPSFVEAHPGVAGRVHCETFRVPTGTRPARVAVESTWLAARVIRDEVEVVHHYGGVVAPISPRPVVLTLHDVQPLEAGAEFTGIKARWLKTMIPRSVAQARVVSVPSEFVRGRLVALTGVDPSKVVVHPHGVALEVANRDLSEHQVASVRRRFRLPGRFFLYPAITYPHKDHQVLVEAFAEVHRRHPDVRLVLTGGEGECEEAVAAAIERHGVGGAVRRVGRVTRAELLVLYRTASALTYASRYEGFGLPLAQAMSVGCPVIASDAASIPEVLGGAGRLVAPGSVPGWAAAMDSVLTDDATTQRLVALGREHVVRLSWKNLAPLTLDMYRRALAYNPTESP